MAARRAFTLIELLVVISIISLLLSLALPALGGARAASRACACLCRMRQLALFTDLYADANKDLMPRSSHSAAGSRSAPWGYAFYESINDSAYDGPGPAWESTLNTHYRCPLDARRNRYSYGYNVYFELSPEETGGPLWRRRASTPRPSATVLFGELEDASVADHAMAHFWTQYSAPPEINDRRHRPGAGVLFLDAHAATLTLGKLFDPKSNLNKWDPATAQ
ncbi:MAG: prepilin-type N-terminal cleavage/methylation domain-containing protein [Phycisphaerales bacterium]|nr:prepilin-type N-terminal cleavage/methylation domain-containing protein [Phycisphaerales bacterium]